MASTAVAVAVVASHDSGRRVLEGRQQTTGSDGPGGQTMVFGGSATTLGRGALDEELHIQGNRCRLGR